MKLRLTTFLLPALVLIACGTAQTTPSPAASSTPTTSPTGVPTTQPSTTPTLAPTNAPPTAPPTGSPTTNPSPAPAGAALLVEITTEGGFIAPSARLGQLPDVVVDTAGNIYRTDPNSTGATLIPQAVVESVGESGAAQILAALKAAGLDTQLNNGGGPGNPDAGVTVVTVDVDGNEVVNRITGGTSVGPGTPGHPSGSGTPVTDLIQRLEDPTETWGATDATPKAFTPTAYKVYSAAGQGSGSSTVEWPLSMTLAEFGTPSTPDFGITGLRTGAVTGDDAAKLTQAFASAAPDTLVTSDGTVYQVWVRPLLPPEL